MLHQIPRGAALNAEFFWTTYFPDFAGSADSSIQKLMASARIVDLPAEKTVFQPGSQCAHYYLLLEGTIRVFVLTASGREVLLYRVHGGEGCVITTSCLLGDDPYNVFGTSDGVVKAFAIPSSLFHETLQTSEPFRKFVFRGFAHRLSLVLARLESLVEGDIDQMLADVLLQLSQNNKVTITHQLLADRIGTAREVVSRHLKRYETEGWVELSRGSITLLDIAALKRHASKKSPGRDTGGLRDSIF